MKSLKVNKGLLQSEVYLPSSKSYANRVLILGAILPKSPSIHNLPKASDVTNLIKCLEVIGLKIEHKNNSVKFANTFPACESSAKELDVGDGGTTARFLATMLLLGKQPYTLKLGKRLKDRPWKEFLDLAVTLGAKAVLDNDKLTIQGPIKLPENLEIDCSKTTQFATAFQLIAYENKTKIIPLNLKSSLSYWQMTEKLLKEMIGVEDYTVPLDWSSASYPLAFGALNHKITFPGLIYDENQADSKFLEILKQFDAITYSADGSIMVSPIKRQHSVTFDVSDALDLVPALAFFLAHLPGKHQLSGIQNLIHKESDRLNEVIKLLGEFGKKATTDGINLIIEGNEGLINESKDLHMVDDHRMVMSASLFLLHHQGGTISPAEAVEKSYPDFFQLVRRPAQ
jgi:3-phosphoshikimate 1-carboxyvinyltransferase